VLLSLISLAALVSYRSIKPKLIRKLVYVRYIPEILLAVICTTFLTYALSLDKKGVSILGGESTSFSFCC